MKPRGLIWLSVALNVAFAAAIFLAAKKTPAPDLAAAAWPLVIGTNLQSGAAIDKPASDGPPFLWRRIASEDLQAYRGNLLAIGCPEITMREIIRAVINERFGVRRRRILDSFQDRYWDMVLRRELTGRQKFPRTEWGQALESLKAERLQLITDVLGRDGLITEAERQARRAALEQQRSWLSPEERDQLIELEEKHQQQLADWAETLGSRLNGVPTQEDEDRLQKWQQDFDEAEKQLLTPDELAELHLRESAVTDWAGSLPGFAPTEDQWRSLTGLRSRYAESEHALASPDLTDDERVVRQNELQASFDSAVQAALPPDQFAQYQLANNDQYQALHNVTQRYSLPDSVVAESLGVQQAAQAQADQVRASSNLSPDAQQSALNAIQQETERTLSQILGEKVLSTYKEYGGDWIAGLGQTQ
ncbi:MAG: hypothetical protein WAO02_02020 [Verrucomicrobiia bacterium]